MGVSKVCKLGMYYLQNPKKRLGLVSAFLVRSFPSSTSLLCCLLSSGLHSEEQQSGITATGKLQQFLCLRPRCAWLSIQLVRHQENTKNKGILNFLKYVPSGGRFEPNFRVFENTQANGAQMDPFFPFLQKGLPRLVIIPLGS